jgi:phage recombination protein Bet
MSLPTIWTPPELHFSPKELQNIRALVPPEASAVEFDRFIAMCKARGLDPRLGHAFLFVFNAKKSNRSSVIVVSEQGYLAAADRCRGHNGDMIYLPDDQPPRFVYDTALKNPATNPLGIESCEVAVRKFVQGEWHRIPALVYWDERAPIVEDGEWDQGEGKFKPNGKKRLDPKKTGWIKQPRTMIAKCGRVAACRYAFPDQFGGLYAEEERDAIERGQLEVIDLSPTEIIQHSVRQEQLKAMGADKAVLFDFRDGKGLVHVPLGLIHDRIEAHFRANPEPEKIEAFVGQNRNSIKEWIGQGGGAKGEWIDLRARYVDPAAAELEACKRKQDGTLKTAE